MSGPVRVVTLLVWIAQACPLHVLVTTLRTVLNAWATDRRYGTRGNRCMLGCDFADVDDFRHNMCCPMPLLYFAARPDLSRLVWMLGGPASALRYFVLPFK